MTYLAIFAVCAILVVVVAVCDVLENNDWKNREHERSARRNQSKEVWRFLDSLNSTCNPHVHNRRQLGTRK
jgi:hypothetical protein